MASASTSKTLPTDANNNPIQLSNSFTMSDATSTPQVSPIASGTSEVALVWPTNAIKLNVYAPSAAVKLRVATGTDDSGVATIPATSWFSIPGRAGGTTYINRPNATTLEFVFELLA